jgi:hypothetical protein
MEWPAILGVYGAIVASMTAAWNIWSGLRDRGRLKLELDTGSGLAVQHLGHPDLASCLSTLVAVDLPLGRGGAVAGSANVLIGTGRRGPTGASE